MCVCGSAFAVIICQRMCSEVSVCLISIFKWSLFNLCFVIFVLTFVILFVFVHTMRVECVILYYVLTVICYFKNFEKSLCVT